MILTDYYNLEKLADKKSLTRRDCTASTGGYPLFESIAAKSRDNRFFIHLTGVPDNFNAHVKRRAELTISNQENISSVFVPDITQRVGHGDVKGTLDALLIIFNEDYTEMEIFVSRGQKHNQKQIFFLYEDGELNQEIEQLKQQKLPNQ
jgi:hypothetical protein